MEKFEFIKENNNCNICFEFYNNAVTLYCGHSYCEECIYYGGKIQSCPVCRK